MKVRWTSQAASDLREAHDYIAKNDDVATAQKIIVKVLDAISALPNHPKMGRRGRVKGTRELIVSGTPFLVPYCIRKEHVAILGVIHGRRRWPRRFETNG